jgi:signal peptidase I
MEDENRPAKEPWLAVSLSWFVPGVGQCYAGAWVSGLLFLGGWLALGFLALWQLASAQGRLWVAGLLVLGGLVFWFVGLFHGHYSARRRNSSEAEHQRRQSKDPFLAVFLTLIVPGAGHFYLKRWLGGALLLIVAVVLWVVSPGLPPPGSSLVGVLLGAVVLSTYKSIAALLAYRAGRSQYRRNTAGILGVCLLGLGIGPLPFAAGVAAREYAVEAFRVSGGSMSPTLQQGDRILVRKGSYGPERGDVIAYRKPFDPDVKYLHRVAALGGQTIEVRSDGIWVDGERLSEKPFADMKDILPAPPSLLDRACATEGKPLTVPHGHLFLLGDNINNALDSRYLGPVTLEAVVGKAYKRYWPLSREGPIH